MVFNSYLHDECWEIIFKFIINNNDFNSLSLVSKQFLSITNHLRSSLTVDYQKHPFLHTLLKRFTNLTTLELTNRHADSDYRRYKNLDALHIIHFHEDHDLDVLLCQISNFPLKLTSLKLPKVCTIPVNGLRAFSQNITTLTSLTCSKFFLRNNGLSLIADSFPFLKQLNLHHPLAIYETNYINGIQYLLSKCPCIQHLDLCYTSFLNDQHVDELSLFLGNLLSINLSLCSSLTESTLISLVRNCPSLSEIKMERTTIGRKKVENSNYLTNSGVCPQLKSLYLGQNSWLSDEIIIKFASIFPNLQLLDLNNCNCICDSICQVLKKCCKLKHLNLDFCSKVKLHGMNFPVPNLEVLNLSNTNVDDETLYMISKNCWLLQLLLKNCHNVSKKGVKHVVENCTQHRKDVVPVVAFSK